MSQLQRYLSCEEVNAWDMVHYLSELGHQAQKIRGEDYWYLSPLREEKTASFKVYRKGNVWYDHGMGKGGSVVDFCLAYFGGDVQ
ncbi:MAG: DNA primase, partial [Hymenobacter sp.]